MAEETEIAIVKNNPVVQMFAVFLGNATKYADLLAALGIISIVVMMVIPIPSFLLDFLMSMNIAIGLVLVLSSTYINDALEFSVFPSLLLVTTLFRLALNVSSTRLILLDAANFDGEVIRAFGNFVVGGNYVVGIIIFIILVIVQFMVITKGSERVAEVAARFTLDSLPGKQMSIDADLNAGLIEEDEAKERRAKLQKEIEFYGAMDGASKFVKGDSIAGIIITVINLVGGMIIGYFSGAFDSIGEIAQTYFLLTIGDGLVSIIPSLLISVSAGIVVTITSGEENLGQEVISQLMGKPKPLLLSSGVFIMFAAIPGLPKIPFILLAVLLGGAGYVLLNEITPDAIEGEEGAEGEDGTTGAKAGAEGSSAEGDEEGKSEDSGPEDVTTLLQIDTLELEIGYGLIPMVDPNQGGDLLNRVKMIRRQIAMELGLVVPAIRIRDNMQLAPNQYSIKLKGVEVGGGELYHDKFLAMDPGMVVQKIEGIATVEPAFNLPALWIEESQREDAEMNGYTVVDSPSVVATHLTELIKKHAPEILGRKEVKELVDKLKETAAIVVESAIPEDSVPRLGLVQKVLQGLLKEGVSIRNLTTILETIADFVEQVKDIPSLVDQVRHSLARQITMDYVDGNILRVMTLDPSLEQRFVEGFQKSGNIHSALAPDVASRFFTNLNQGVETMLVKGYTPILMCSPFIRIGLKDLVERSVPQLVLLSFQEIVTDIQIEQTLIVGLDS